MEAMNLESSNLSYSAIASSAGGSDCESILGLGGLEAYVKVLYGFLEYKRARWSIMQFLLRQWCEHF